MFEHLRRDTRRLQEIKNKSFPWYVLESLLFENGYQAVVLYRLARWFKERRIPFFGPFFARVSLFLTGVDIAPGAEIGPGLRISHGTGLVIGGYARIGTDALLLHGATVGSPEQARVHEMPVIGDHLFLGAGAKVIGRITLGDHVLVGANAVVTRDVPSHSKVVVAREAIEVRTTQE